MIMILLWLEFSTTTLYSWTCFSFHCWFGPTKLQSATRGCFREFIRTSSKKIIFFFGARQPPSTDDGHANLRWWRFGRKNERFAYLVRLLTWAVESFSGIGRESSVTRQMDENIKTNTRTHSHMAFSQMKEHSSKDMPLHTHTTTTISKRTKSKQHPLSVKYVEPCFFFSLFLSFVLVHTSDSHKTISDLSRLLFFFNFQHDGKCIATTTTTTTRNYP